VTAGYARQGPAAVVTIDRPERRNAVDGDTAAALPAAFARFCADDGARVAPGARRFASRARNS
jgi:enoyl-CoA hydratase